MAFAQALVICLIALAIAPGYAFYEDVTPKAAALLAGTALVLSLAFRGQSPRSPRLFTGLLWLNALSLAASTAVSRNPGISFLGSSWRGFGALTQTAAMLFAWLVAWQSTGRPDRVRTILRGIAIAGVLAGALGIVFPHGTMGDLVGDAGNVAVWLAMSMFLAMALAGIETHVVWRMAARAASVLMLAALCVTAVRAPPWTGVSPMLWRDSLSMAARRPVFGHGPETFLARFPQSESKALAEADPDRMYESPRNAFVDALVSQGAVGLLALCGLCAAGLAAAWKRRNRWMAAALAAGIVSLQFISFTIPTAVLFFTAVALACSSAEDDGPPRRSPVLSAIAPFIVLALLYVTVRLAMADHSLVVTRRLLDARDFSTATDEYEQYWFWRLPGASADLWYAQSWMSLARSDYDPAVRDQAREIAASAAARAIENAEAPFAAWFNRAQVAALLADFDDAEGNLRLAIAEHPNWYRPHWMLAQQLFQQFRRNAAQKEASLAAELDAGHHPEVARTLAEIAAGSDTILR